MAVLPGQTGANVRQIVTGTASPFTLGAAVANYLTLAAIGGVASDTFYGTCEEVDASGNRNGVWVYGLWTIGSGTVTLTTALRNSAGGTTAPTFGAGTKHLYISDSPDASIATDSLIGRITAGAGQAEVLTVAQVKTLLALAIADIAGLQAAIDDARPWTYVILGSDFEVTTTTNSNITGLFFTPEANLRYEVEGRFFLQAAATTTGARPGISWPAGGVSQNSAWMMSGSSATAFTSRIWGNTSTANAASTGVAVANEGQYGQLQALVVMGGSPSGNFQITLASEVAASAARMMTNSFIRYRTY